MKTKKFNFDPCSVAFATMNYSTIADEAPRFTVKITLKAALQTSLSCKGYARTTYSSILARK